MRLEARRHPPHALGVERARRAPGRSAASTPHRSSCSRTDVGSGFSTPTSAVGGLEHQGAEQRFAVGQPVGVAAAVQPALGADRARLGWWCAPPSCATRDRSRGAACGADIVAGDAHRERDRTGVTAAPDASDARRPSTSTTRDGRGDQRARAAARPASAAVNVRPVRASARPKNSAGSARYRQMPVDVGRAAGGRSGS